MGVINLFKEPGLSSFDSVRRIRRLFNTRKVGHAGTLDPLACGVLPLCLGRATRLAPFIQDSIKVYRGEMVLGVETETHDGEGSLVSFQQVEVGTEELKHLFASSRGRQEQLPPRHSARSQQGRRYYQLAREGREFERQKKEVEIYRLDLIHREENRVIFEVAVSRGTYIRSLVYDLGARLGCGAYLSFLLRKEVGPFKLASALSLPEIELRLEESDPESVLLPLDAGLVELPAVHITAWSARRVKNGVPFTGEEITSQEGEWELEKPVRVYGPQQEFLALYYPQQNEEGLIEYRAGKVFA